MRFGSQPWGLQHADDLHKQACVQKDNENKVRESIVLLT